MSSDTPPMATTRLRQQRQLQFLEAAMQRWLPDFAASFAGEPRWLPALRRAVLDWQCNGDAGLEQLTAIMHQAVQTAGIAPPPDHAAIAFARALVAQASDDIAREARRAGHQTTFDGLQAWLEAPLPADVAETLALQLQREPAHLQLALSRLRRRFRQRIEAGLALWSVTAEQRTRLRRQLHAALSSGNSP